MRCSETAAALRKKFGAPALRNDRRRAIVGALAWHGSCDNIGTGAAATSGPGCFSQFRQALGCEHAVLRPVRSHPHIAAHAAPVAAGALNAGPAPPTVPRPVGGVSFLKHRFWVCVNGECKRTVRSGRARRVSGDCGAFPASAAVDGLSHQCAAKVELGPAVSADPRPRLPEANREA